MGFTSRLMLAVVAFVSALPTNAQGIHWEKCRPGQPNTADKTCVVDGDTIWLNGINVRLEGYDTPEPQTNICGGDREKALADKASDWLVELLNTRTWEVDLSGAQGSYGREIGTIKVDGRDVGEILVEEGLARWWPNGAEWWCD